MERLIFCISMDHMVTHSALEVRAAAPGRSRRCAQRSVAIAMTTERAPSPWEASP